MQLMKYECTTVDGESNARTQYVLGPAATARDIEMEGRSAARIADRSSTAAVRADADKAAQDSISKLKNCGGR